MQLYKSGRPTEVKPLEAKKTSVPNAKGEYRIINSENREVEYIGYSNNLNRRMKEHIRTGKINSQNSIFAYKVADGRASRNSLAEHETQKIKQHNPAMNQRAGGAGRPFK